MNDWTADLKVGDILLFTVPEPLLIDDSPWRGLSGVITALDGSDFSHAGIIVAVDPVTGPTFSQMAWPGKDDFPTSSYASGVCRGLFKEYVRAVAGAGLTRRYRVVRPTEKMTPGDFAEFCRLLDEHATALHEYECHAPPKPPKPPTPPSDPQPDSINLPHDPGTSDYGVDDLVLAALACVGRRTNPGRLRNAIWSTAQRVAERKDFGPDAQPTVLGTWPPRSGRPSLRTAHCNEYVTRLCAASGLELALIESSPAGTWKDVLDQVRPHMEQFESWVDTERNTRGIVEMPDSAEAAAKFLLDEAGDPEPGGSAGVPYAATRFIRNVIGADFDGERGQRLKDLWDLAFRLLQPILAFVDDLIKAYLRGARPDPIQYPIPHHAVFATPRLMAELGDRIAGSSVTASLT